jgi:hypothetical protein
MSRATGPIINSRDKYRETMNQMVDDVCGQLEFYPQTKQLDFFLLLPVLNDRIVTVLVGQSNTSCLRIELLAGSEAKEPKPERNRDRKLKPVADVLLSPTGIKKVTMR